MSRHPACPLTRADMPISFEITLDRYTQDRSTRIPDDPGPEQALRGFDGYRNIVDYIVRITHRIWESGDHGSATRDIDYIAQCYAANSQVFDDFGLQHGNTKIIEDTRNTTRAFPAMTLDAEEVIWAGDDEVGFHTSHRVRISGINDGEGRFGAATGKKVDFLCIANCVALENEIFLEHVLYNTATMLRDLGIDPMEEAARLVTDPPEGWPRTDAEWDALRTGAAPAAPLSLAEPIAGFDPDAFARTLHHKLWSDRDPNDLGAFYADDATFEGVGHRRHAGMAAHAEMIREMADLLADPVFQVDEVYWMGNDADGYLISTRWSLEATHDGGPYGPATGARLRVWGISQQEVRGGKVQAEWMLFNEMDVMMQIATARTAG